MKTDDKIREGRLAPVCILMVFSALLMLDAGCWSRTPAQRAEKAFIKLFEKDYPDWKVSRIVLTPCKAKSKYRGKFECAARSSTRSCWLRRKEYVGWEKKYIYCSCLHAEGAVIVGDLLVTYAHGDCFYDLHPFEF